MITDFAGLFLRTFFIDALGGGLMLDEALGLLLHVHGLERFFLDGLGVLAFGSRYWRWEFFGSLSFSPAAARLPAAGRGDIFRGVDLAQWRPSQSSPGRC